MRKNVLSAITDTGLIAIMRVPDHKHNLKTAEALIRGAR